MTAATELTGLISNAIIVGIVLIAITMILLCFMKVSILEKLGKLMLGFLFLFILYSFADSILWGNGCRISTIGHPELYCYQDCTLGSCDDYSSDSTFKVGNHTYNALVAEQQHQQAIYTAEQQRIAQECYNSGKDYAYNFSVFVNYNLTCSKVAYINDHFIDKTRQVDGGYIKGSYSGFFSSGHIEGHLYQYVTEGVLATGQLMKTLNYHLDCNNVTSNKVATYYSESDFVMEYVNKCIPTENITKVK